MYCYQSASINLERLFTVTAQFYTRKIANLAPISDFFWFRVARCINVFHYYKYNEVKYYFNNILIARPKCMDYTKCDILKRFEKFLLLLP